MCWEFLIYLVSLLQFFSSDHRSQQLNSCVEQKTDSYGRAAYSEEHGMSVEQAPTRQSDLRDSPSTWVAE